MNINLLCQFSGAFVDSCYQPINNMLVFWMYFYIISGSKKCWHPWNLTTMLVLCVVADIIWQFNLHTCLYVLSLQLLQVFESHAGVLGPSLFSKFSLPYLQQMSRRVKDKLIANKCDAVPMVRKINSWGALTVQERMLEKKDEVCVFIRIIAIARCLVHLYRQMHANI